MTDKTSQAERPRLAPSTVTDTAAATFSQHALLGCTLRQPPGGHLSHPWGLSRRLHGDRR